MLVGACASVDAPPTHFGPWGPMTPVQEPDRSVLVAAISALTKNDARSVVLARYAGDRFERLDLAPLRDQVRVTMDIDGKLGPIDEGSPKYRARVFETDFRGKTTILELSVPKVRGASATVAAWRWDALAWKCELPGRAEHVTLRLVDGRWSVTATSTDRGAVLLKKGCP